MLTLSLLHIHLGRHHRRVFRGGQQISGAAGDTTQEGGTTKRPTRIKDQAVTTAEQHSRKQVPQRKSSSTASTVATRRKLPHLLYLIRSESSLLKKAKRSISALHIQYVPPIMVADGEAQNRSRSRSRACGCHGATVRNCDFHVLLLEEKSCYENDDGTRKELPGEYVPGKADSRQLKKVSCCVYSKLQT